MSKKEKKTNAMRQLDTAGIPYEVLTYTCDGVNFDGRLVAEQVGLPCCQVFKTLVSQDDKSAIVVCCIPVDKKLDLKALAASAGHKRLELIPMDKILPLTGYVRGGCSPIGMKKQYPTFVDASALEQSKLAVSGGLRGFQILLAPENLILHTHAKTGRFSVEEQE